MHSVKIVISEPGEYYFDCHSLAQLIIHPELQDVKIHFENPCNINLITIGTFSNISYSGDLSYNFISAQFKANISKIELIGDASLGG